MRSGCSAVSGTIGIWGNLSFSPSAIPLIRSMNLWGCCKRMKESLKRAHIRYKHVKKLGGLRHTAKDSINLGWRNASFRGFADYMASDEFEEGLQSLIKIANVRNTAIMCAEAVPWRCHRSLIADALTKKGWLVRDIMSRTSAPKHRLTPFLKVRKGQLIYPAPKT
jgi:uncharacterized protein (DUF488 family)